MANPRSIAIAAAAILSLAWFAGTIPGASAGASPRREPAARGEYYVTPLSRELSGHAAQLIPFEFEVRASGSAMAVKVEPVALRQEESGAIALDTAAASLPGLELQSPERLVTRPQTPAMIRGRVVVQSDSPLRSYGILVTELGPADGAGAPESGTKPQVGVGVRFITRYLLRLDVKARGLSHQRLRELEVVDGVVVPREGRAVVGARVLNVTADGFEFDATCTLFNSRGQQMGKPFPLVMPIRANTAAEAERKRSRSLPGSAVRIEERVPEPLPAGDYRARIDLRSGEERLTSEYGFSVAPGDFPAQDRLLPRIVAAVEVTPARIELSLQPGGTRIGAVTLANTSDEPVDVDLAAEAYLGADASWLRVQPDRVELPPGGKRTVRVVPSITGNTDDSRYATLRLRVTPRDGSAGGEQPLPVVLIGRADTPASFEVGEIALDRNPQEWAFVLPVSNIGQRHLELNARVAVLDPFGRPVEHLTGGYGDWVLPGGPTADLRLVLPRPLPAGEYVLKGTVEVGRGSAPLAIERRWRIGEAMGSVP